MKKNLQGFTLIEVMIAIAILATMGTLVAQSIQQAIKSKKKIQEQVDITSRMRDGMKLLERDIQLAYHHRDWEKELLLATKKRSTQSTKTGQPPVAPDSSANNPNVDPFTGTTVEAARLDPSTHFVGTENELHFVTLNNGRLSKTVPQADFSEVGYTLKDCKSTDGKSSSKCLWRRTSPWVDKDVTIGGEEVVLLENVSEFSLKYLGKGKQDWDKTWKSTEAGDGATKGNFPSAVEVSLTILHGGEKGKPKKYSMQVVVPIHFPNNREEGSPNPDGSQSLPAGSVPAGGPFSPGGNTTTPAAGQPQGGNQ